jgi:hypothetical protein
MLVNTGYWTNTWGRRPSMWRFSAALGAEGGQCGAVEIREEDEVEPNPRMLWTLHTFDFAGRSCATISLSREQRCRRRQMTREAQQGSAAAFEAAFRLGLREFDSLVRSFEYSPTVSRLRGSDRPFDQRTPSRAMTTPTSHLGMPF